MHYQGTKVPLSEKSTRFKSAGIPTRRFWGNRYSALESRREPKEEKKFSLRIFNASKPEVRPVGANHTFYRPGGAVIAESSLPREKTERFNRFFGNQNSSERKEAVQTERKRNPFLGRVGLKPLVWVTAVVLVILAGWWMKQKAVGVLEGSSGLKLARVMVEGAHYLTQDEVLKTANLSLGSGMFDLNLEDLNQKLKKLSWVDQVFVERRLPSSILISIRERKPVALLDNGSLYGVDKDGRILSPSESLLNQDLPLISGVAFGADAVGTTQTAQVLKPALDFFSFIVKKDGVLAHDVSEVNLSERESLKVTFINGAEVTFNTTVSETDLKRMALVLGDLNEKGKKASTMDFRYKDMAFVRTR
jgi:cell division septal protein FtsQ